MSYETVEKELGIHHSIVSRWVKRFGAEGIKGLEEKRGKTKGPGVGSPRGKSENPESKIKRLEAVNEMLKKFLEPV
ncbi:helix-turn-helix domain-containing protein [Bacillus thuringiensis]|uniref:helix-turn-helix domain-containing protein n=1 Tax=Bacillus thuringiensis TaxID=1428 RepID=UPI001F5137C6|nr:helix-turn-helix domain-containing protein [Bacillus thuringiensis]